jgi:hypothetical protein
MNAPPNPSSAQDAARRETSPERGPAPFYHHPFFWLFAGMIAGVIPLTLYFCLYGLPREAAPAGSETTTPGDLLAIQRAQNKGLEEEIQRLRAALKDDPCALPEVIGEGPDKTPAAPDYAPADADANPPSGVRPPDASGQAPPAGNATAPSALPAPTTVGVLMDQATVFVLSSLGDQIGMGSGFFVAPGVVATNRHVVQGGKAAVYVGNKALGGMREARIIAFSQDESRDYALLRIAPALASRAPTLRITEDINRTDHVSAWGFPGYITEIDPKLAALIKGDDTSVPEVVYSEGVVSVVLDRNPPVILHTAAISQGNSGGPLVNGQGIVVGINTFIKAADQSYAQANIALPGKDLALFMQEHGIAASLAAK